MVLNSRSQILYQIRKYDNQFNTLLSHDVDVDQPDDDEAPLLSSAYNNYNSVSVQNDWPVWQMCLGVWCVCVWCACVCV